MLCTIPLVLEMGSFDVPIVNFIWDSIEGHDLLYEQGGDSSSEEADKDIMVCDASMVTLLWNVEI